MITLHLYKDQNVPFGLRMFQIILVEGYKVGKVLAHYNYIWMFHFVIQLCYLTKSKF